ncbi:SHSP domain-containing protein [Plasmodiophora brassicae]|nr:hypothetical protein PBRA_001651 [Plasmodiophora brassicae]
MSCRVWMVFLGPRTVDAYEYLTERRRTVCGSFAVFIRFVPPPVCPSVVTMFRDRGSVMNMRRAFQDIQNMFDTLADPSFAVDQFMAPSWGTSSLLDLGPTPLVTGPVEPWTRPSTVTSLAAPTTGALTTAPSSWLSPWSATTTQMPIVSLPLDVSETDKEMTIKADVPGMDKSNFSIRVVNNNLEIACERKEEYVREDERTRARERRWGRAVRTLRLQDNIDVPHITSEYVDGVLKLYLPKTSPTPSNVKTIEIQ